MGATVSELRRLQEVELQLVGIRRNREGKARRVEVQQTKVRQIESRIEENHRAAKAQQMKVDELTLDVASREDSVDKHRQALNKAKTNKDIVNYAISGPHDDQEYYNWVRQPTGEYACGLFEVGNPTAIGLYQPRMSYNRLNDVLARAKTANVKRVYWLACQALG